MSPPDSSYLARLQLSVIPLVEAGIPIFEVGPDKKPRTKRGFKDASLDSEKVLRFRKDSMAAGRTGKISNVVVVDLDVNSAKGIDGRAWLREAEAKFGRLPPHPTASTPRGGEHHYFKYPEGRSVRCTAGKIGPGVDTRADGGYVVLSESETSSGKYSWSISPADVAIPEMPDWLLNLVADKIYDAAGPVNEPSSNIISEADREKVASEIVNQLKRVTTAKEGARNTALNLAAFVMGKMVAAGAAVEIDAISLLSNAAQTAGLEERETQATIRSALNAGKRQPWMPYAVDNQLVALNRDHFFALEGKSSFVFREELDPVTQNRSLARIHPGAFKDQYGNRTVTFIQSDGQSKSMRLGHAWMSWPGRRQFERVTFLPGGHLPLTVYNQWQGFTAEPIEGNCESFRNYMLEVLCGGDSKLLEYLECWCARAVQQPWLAGEVAVVLRGNKGTGKTFFALHFGELFGDHYVELTNSRHLVGNFNAHLETAVIVFADEAFWAGDKPGEGPLKGLITGKHLLLERKGIDARTVPNRTHLIIASNADWVVPASGDERRFFVMTVSAKHRNDHAYFAALEEDWQIGGREAFLYHLLKIDISKFNVRRVPQTVDLLEQKLASLGVVDRWYYEQLQLGQIGPSPYHGWDEWVSTKYLYDRLTDHCKNDHSRIPTREAFGMRMSILVPPRPGHKSPRVQRADGQERVWGYELGSLAGCRKHFEQVLNFSIEWETPGEIEKVLVENKY